LVNQHQIAALAKTAEQVLKTGGQFDSALARTTGQQEDWIGFFMPRHGRQHSHADANLRALGGGRVQGSIQSAAQDCLRQMFQTAWL
jgi:hypothetical protein